MPHNAQHRPDQDPTPQGKSTGTGHMRTVFPNANSDQSKDTTPGDCTDMAMEAEEGGTNIKE